MIIFLHHCKCHDFVFNSYQQEEFEDTKGIIIIRISKKIKQHNGRKNAQSNILN